jgi:hypothetical protein
MWSKINFTTCEFLSSLATKFKMEVFKGLEMGQAMRKQGR